MLFKYAQMFETPLSKCEVFFRRVWSDRFSSIQHNVRNLSVRTLFEHSNLFGLVALSERLFLLCRFNIGDALHYLQWHNIMVITSDTFARLKKIQKISFRGESLFMMLMYVVYCIVLHFNPQLEEWAHRLPVPCKPHSPEEQSGLMTYKTLDNEEGKQRSNYGLSPEQEQGGWCLKKFFFFCVIEVC